jgi:hypothetical protein
VEYLIWVVVIGSSIWVGIDASQIGARRGPRFFDMGPAGWLFATLLIWIIAFPAYLVMRERIKAANQTGAPQSGLYPYQATGQQAASYPPPQQPGYPVPPVATPAAIPPSAGWHVDPNDPSLLRWWDGVGWSEHFKPREAQ